MKKLCFVFLSVLMIACLLAGCHQSPEGTSMTTTLQRAPVISNPTEGESDRNYTIKLCGFSDSVSGVEHTLEFDAWSKGSFTNPEAASKMEFSVGEFSGEAEYKSSERNMYEFYDTHQYKSSDKKYFMTTSEGVLSGCFFGKCTNDDENAKELSEEECISVAKEFVSHIVDPEKYTIKTVLNKDRGTYDISFSKSINDFKCADSAKVSIDKHGHIYSFSSTMFGKISDDISTDFDLEDVEKQIYLKVDDEYAEKKEQVDEIRYDKVNYVLTVDENGSPILVSWLDISFVNFVGEYETVISERLCFVIK